jgi:hypothetical protein
MDYRNAYYYLFQEVTEMIKSLQQIQKASVEICLQQPVANGIKKEKKEPDSPTSASGLSGS